MTDYRQNGISINNNKPCRDILGEMGLSNWKEKELVNILSYFFDNFSNCTEGLSKFVDFVAGVLAEQFNLNSPFVDRQEVLEALSQLPPAQAGGLTLG